MSEQRLTLLAALIERDERTHAEIVAAFERCARDNGDDATLSLRTLRRWMVCDVRTAPRPSQRRVARLFWGHPMSELLAPAPEEFLLTPTTGEMSTAVRTTGLSDPLQVRVTPHRAGADWPFWFGLRLAHMLAVIDNWQGSCVDSEGLQTLLHQEILMFDAVTPEYCEPAHILSRRQALVTLSALPMTITTGNLSRAAAAESFVARCAASLTACWHLLRGSDLYSVDQMLSAFLLELEGIAQQQSAHQRAAARLASQAHRICGIIALHHDHLKMREYHCKQALRYATLATDVNSQVSALVSLASTYFYDADPAKAVDVYEHALSHESAMSPLQRSRVHAELAVVYGQLGQECKAFQSIELAENLYPRHPEQDPSFLFAEFTRASLTLEQGLAYLALAERHLNKHYHRQAADVFARAEQAPPAAVPDRIRFEIINHRARAAVMLNDLDAFETYLNRGIDGAIRLGSRQRQKETRLALRHANARWPNEPRLATIGGRVHPVVTSDAEPTDVTPRGR
jgi:tetratricopeptide (TPR) repeat protein